MNETLIALAVFSALYVGLIFAVHRGVSASRNTLEEFLVSGRNLSLSTTVATLGATEIGLITIAYNAQKGFNDGFAAFHIGLAALIGCVFIGLTGFVVKPMRAQGVLTLPEYYDKRFGRDVRVLGALLMAFGGILNMGLFLKVGAFFLAAMFAPKGVAIDPILLMGILTGVAVAYTVYGGMRSVVATDVFQFVLMLLGMIAAIWFLIGVVPFDEAVETVRREKGEAGFNPLIAPSFGWVYMLWMVFVAGIVSSAIWPTALTRAILIADQKQVQSAYLISSVIFMARMVIPAFLGVLAFAYFATGGAGEAAREPLLAPYGEEGDLAATAAMLGHALPPWLLGFIAIAMFSSFMSTQSGYLHCWSSILARDVIGALIGRADDASFQIRTARILIVLIALYELYWGLIYRGEEDVWDYLAISGSIYFCSGVVLLGCGLYWKRATRRGALLALLFGFSAILALPSIKNAVGLGDFSSAAIGFAAVGLSLFGMIAGSLSERPHPRLLEGEAR
jgi:SSS family solute:Na+ symporter